MTLGAEQGRRPVSDRPLHSVGHAARDPMAHRGTVRQCVAEEREPYSEQCLS